MCDEKQAVVGRAAGRKAQQQHDAQVAAEAVRAYQQAQQPQRGGWRLRFDKATDTAQNVLAAVGAVLVMAAFGSGAISQFLGVAMRVVLIFLAAAAGLAWLTVLAMFGRRWWRLHRQPDFAPWHQPQAPAVEQLKPEVQALMRAGVLPQLEAWQGQPAITRTKVRK